MTATLGCDQTLFPDNPQCGGGGCHKPGLQSDTFFVSLTSCQRQSDSTAHSLGGLRQPSVPQFPDASFPAPAPQVSHRLLQNRLRHTQSWRPPPRHSLRRRQVECPPVRLLTRSPPGRWPRARPQSRGAQVSEGGIVGALEDPGHGVWLREIH